VVALLARYHSISIINVRVNGVLRRTDLIAHWYTTNIRVFLKCRKVLFRVNVFCKEMHILPHLMINMWRSYSTCQALGWCVALFNVWTGWPRNTVIPQLFSSSNYANVTACVRECVRNMWATATGARRGGCDTIAIIIGRNSTCL